MSVFVTRTSQKLNFVQLQLEQLAQADESTGWSRQARLECAQEGVLFQLVSAYGALLREIAHHYRLDAAKVQQFADLDALFERAALQSPERTELASLEQAEGSWLRCLRSAYEACWQSGTEVRTANAAASSQSEISLVQLGGGGAEAQVTPQQCRQWYRDLAQLAERLRAGMQEW
ncbi:DUF6586 family protein [Marinobacterium rhizophilum]|uniref:PasA protein n=1 Tax=Marinobacterium rhizophilum TaxID=420402 RepID=A0ABY5HQ51_9GAMM|nr:DUF6586 family protein [Marinobacterium rhizophilum]UTW13295.1 hypothetical protein KDW95_06455 [Marinobacterium rhizophilum]